MWKLAILCNVLIQTVSAHSWVECTNYDPVSFDYQTLGSFDAARCNGYPRGFARQFSEGFGVDTGYNWEHQSCRDPFQESDYTDTIPMAKLSAGQTIYISHPSKNHVADTCTNAFIPSYSFVVKMSSQVGTDSFDIDLKMVGDDHANGQIDHLGYQRCYNFCENQDKSHCLTAWTLPNDVPEGRHSFKWVWEFNQGQFYSNCFDAYVSSGSNGTAPTPQPSIIETPEPSTETPEPSTETPEPTTEPPQPTTETPEPTTETPEPSIETPTETPEPELSMSGSASEEMGESGSEEAPSSIREPEVISNGNQLESPLASIGKIILNITGSFNITGLLNVTLF